MVLITHIIAKRLILDFKILIVNVESEYSAVSEVNLRDLRRLDFLFNPNEEKSVLIRRHAVLIAMDPLRAVIMADRLLLIVPDGADELISWLDKHMKGEHRLFSILSLSREVMFILCCLIALIECLLYQLYCSLLYV